MHSQHDLAVFVATHCLATTAIENRLQYYMRRGYQDDAAECAGALGGRHEDAVRLADRLLDAALADETLYAEVLENTWTVQDDSGARWWPNSDTHHVLRTAPCPGLLAIYLAKYLSTEYGTWRQ